MGDEDFKLSGVFAPDQQQPTMGFSNAPNNGGLEGAVGRLGDYFEYAKTQAAQAEAEKMVNIKTDQKTGLANVELPQNLLAQLVQKVHGFDQIQDNYAKMLAENTNRQRQLQQQPWANTLATIAGSLAANDPNPITRGLGQAAQKLNPTAADLQARQLQLLQAQSQGAAHQLDALGRAVSLQGDTKRADLERKVQQDLDNKSAKYMNEARKSVSGGGGQPLDYAAFAAGALAQNIPVERIPLMYQTHVAEAGTYAQGKEAGTARTLASQKSFADHTSELTSNRAKDRDNRQFGQRLALLREGFANSTSKNKMEFDKELATHKAQVGLEYKKLAESGLVPLLEMRKLEDANVTDSYIGKVEAALSRPEIRDIAGPLFSYNPKTGEVSTNMAVITPRLAKSADRVEFEALMAHEIPRLLSVALRGGMGGASLMRTDKGMDLIKQLGSSIGDRPDQILAVMGQIRDTNNDIKSGVMRGRRNVDWTGQYAPLIGLDDPKNQRYFVENKDTMGSPMSAPSAVRAKAPAAKAAAPGYAIGQKDGGYTYVGGDPTKPESWQKN